MRPSLFSRTLATLVLASATVVCMAQQTHMTHHASGTFDVKMAPLADSPAEGLMRMSIDKQIHGALEATTKGEMIGGGDYKIGNAGYVAMETVTGTLDGKKGSFVLQHTATLHGGKPDMTIIVTPGSGTGELTGISGTFTIIIDAQGKHTYAFDYTLPTE